MREGNCHVFFGMFANELKVSIVSELMYRPMGVTELAKALKAERSKVSHALLSLNKCSIVEAEKKGRQREYHLNSRTVRSLLKLAGRHVAKYCKQCWARQGS